ncbi:MAG: outer membrane lipoprotein-sorting protein [Isosphaeraceae bacterium]|nr:outer membrane lipoprotein-sorting protein [Isosphaeraceae bacterium]
MRRFRICLAGLTVLALTSTTFGQDARPGAPATRPAPASSSPAASAPAASPVDPAVEAAQKRRMEELLRLWEKQSARLQTLDVGFKRIDKSPAWDDVEEYRGRAYFQAPTASLPSLACLHFQKVEPDPKDPKLTKLVDSERIVCTGAEVYQYEYRTKQIFIFPLDKDQSRKALDEGPLPFLFNMKADEAKQRYHMQLLRENDQAYLIGVLPLLKEDASVFSQSYLQLNKKTFLPDRLVLISPNGKDTQDYQFDAIAPNTAINPAFFKGAKIQGWKEIYNPAPEQVKGAVEARDPRRAAPRAPAVGRETRPAPRR